MKTFFVIGLSTFGHYVAQFLSERNFDVVVVDSDEERVERTKQFVTKGIIADAKEKTTLTKIGVTPDDAVIVSLGESMDASLLVVLHLKELEIKEIYVKVLTYDHAKIINMLGATEIIFPERDSAYNIAQRIDNPNVLEYLPLMEGFSIIEIAPPSSFNGKTLRELDLRNEYGVQVLIIKEVVPDRKPVMPQANHRVKDSDLLVLMGKNEDLEHVKNLG